MFSFYAVDAQELNQTEEIKKQLNDDQLSMLEEVEAARAKADQQLETANTLMQKVQDKKSKASSAPKSTAKKLQKELKVEEPAAITKKISALTQSSKVNATIYKIYDENLSELEQQATAEKRKISKELLANAETNFKDAERKIKSLPSGKNADQNTILKGREEAERLYNDAVAQQIQAYASLLGWYDQKEDEPEPAPAVVQTPVVQKPVNNDKIIYKVQIAASNTPLSLEKLNRIYKTDEIINNDLEDNIYKYSIGYYSTYEEADALRNKIGVKGAFIVAYRNGKRVPDINEVYHKK